MTITPRLYRRASAFPPQITRPAVVRSRLRPRERWLVVSPWPIPGRENRVIGDRAYAGAPNVRLTDSFAQAIDLATASARDHAALEPS